jgi:predicted MPP superfamily phosphohydrolase
MSFRRRFQKITETLERRIVAKPFADLHGEKGAWVWISRPPRYRIIPHQVAVTGWPETTRPLRLVFLSDLHTGSYAHDVVRLEQIVEDVVKQQPDLVCLGGDYVNGMLFGQGRVPPEVIASKLSVLRPPLGTFAILGDHDELFGASRVLGPLRNAGLRVLVNEVEPVCFEGAEIRIIGLTPDARQLSVLLGERPGSPAVVLTHDPAAFARLPGGPHLMLCGHTHGGQIQLPFVGPLVNMSDAPLRWTYGHVSEGGRNLYITSGLGTSGLPLRIGIPPEIAVIEVVNAL